MKSTPSSANPRSGLDHPLALVESPAATGALDPEIQAFFDDVHSIAENLARLADHFAPQPADIVGTPYIARQLGCTTAWITQQIKEGRLPDHCIVAGTGKGKPWKFHRRHIDQWIKAR